MAGRACVVPVAEFGRGQRQRLRRERLRRPVRRASDGWTVPHASLTLSACLPALDAWEAGRSFVRSGSQHTRCQSLLPGSITEDEKNRRFA